MSTESGTLARQILRRVSVTVLTACSGTQRPLAHLEALRHARWLLDRAEIFLIDAARSDGATWGEVARARGTTRQNERQAQLRRDADAARDPFDQWLERQQRRLREERRARLG